MIKSSPLVGEVMKRRNYPLPWWERVGRGEK